MAESSSNGKKTLWEKEKLLVTSNFFFSHSVFKRLLQHTSKNKGLFGKWLICRSKTIRFRIHSVFLTLSVLLSHVQIFPNVKIIQMVQPIRSYVTSKSENLSSKRNLRQGKAFYIKPNFSATWHSVIKKK